MCGWRFMSFANYGLLTSPMSRRKHKCLSSWHVLAASNTEFLIFAAIVLGSSSECHFAMLDSVVSTFLRAEMNKTTKPQEERRDFRCFKIKYLSLLEAEIAGATIDCSSRLDINGILTICINNFLHNGLSKVEIELFSSACSSLVTHSQKSRLISNDNKSQSICRGNNNSVEFHAVTKIN